MRHHKLNLGLFALFIVAMTIFMVWQGVGITPDRYALGLLLLSFFVKRTRTFLMDWAPFLFILMSYDFFRAFADKLNPRVNYLPQIDWEIFIFGQIPTITLQQAFYQAGTLHWYDFLATIFYFLHFALPLGFGFLIWLKRRDYFKEFTTSLIILSYAAFFTYVAFPAAPPWLSSNLGILPGVTKILNTALGSFPTRLNLPTVYFSFAPNLVAAIPSLHAAYPMLVFIFCIKYFRAKALLFLPYLLGVWISLVYLGEHYAVDVIIGAIYAIAAYIANHYFFKIKLPEFKFLSRVWLKR